LKKDRLKILYVGNKVVQRGQTPTTIDTLAPLLEENYDVITTSDKKNILLRALDIIYTLYRNRTTTNIIIVDTYSTKNFYVSVLVAFFANYFHIKYLPYLHGGNLPKRLESHPKISKYIFKNSAINIAPSKYLENAFIEKGYKTLLIPNNIELSLYPFKERTKLSPKLLYVRALSKVYNPLMLIRVLDKLLKLYPDAELCMVGPDKDGTLEAIKKEASKLNILEHIKFTGKLPKKEWIELSKEYDIFVNPTNFDNQPVSIIEAMALGFPIVSTNVGGLPFLIDHNFNGILVDKNDTEKMTQEIINLLENQKKVNMLSKNARRKAETFSWKNIEKQWEKLLNESA